MLEDGIGEFLNMVAGNAVTGLEQGHPCEVDPPIRGLPPLDAYVFKMNTTAGEALLLLASNSSAPVSIVSQTDQSSETGQPNKTRQF